MKIIRAKDYKDMSRKAANIISAQVIMKPNCVLGLATGGTPVGVHRRWYMGFLVGRNGCNSAVCPIGLLGMVCSRLCPYFHYYAFYHYIRHIFDELIHRIFLVFQHFCISLRIVACLEQTSGG
jgi:hypothetical protein